MLNQTPAPGEDANFQSAELSPDTLGCYLKGARLSQGMDLTGVAEATRIDIKNLTALEHDNRSALPADVFTRGFVRIYASHLKLDPLEAIRRYEQQWGTADLNIDVTPLEKINSPRALWPGIIIAVTLFVIFFGIRFFTSAPPVNTGSISIPDTSSLAIDKNNAPLTTAEAPAEETSLAQEEALPANTSSTKARGTESPPYEIVLTCAEEVPLTINLDNLRTSESVCPSKSPQTWKADKSFDLALSTTRGVTLTINGINVPLMEAGGQSITIHRP